MIPSVLSAQLKTAVGEFLNTTFASSTPGFEDIVEDLVRSEAAFKGPFLSLQLPFRSSDGSKSHFPAIPFSFTPHLHQERTFERLGRDSPKPTIVATGTGSGKTEAFLYPILEHCRKHAGHGGIKAILIYPMNALAGDQSRRIAKIVYETPSLKGQIRAGLYIGGRERDEQGLMTADGIVTNRLTMQLDPPDILLTNYKMLDYLMVRARDAGIWNQNTPGSLRFIVVDELHTFDGAQGTDLACLLRRLKARLKAPNACPVGTSATLGVGDTSDEHLLREFAGTVFDAEFDADSIITEERLSPVRFLGDALIRYVDVPRDFSAGGPTDPSQFAHLDSFVAEQFSQWFGKSVDPKETTHPVWRTKLGDQLKGHASFQNLVKIVGARTLSYEHVADRMWKTGSRSTSKAERLRALDSLLSLVSVARDPLAEDDAKPRPLVNVRYQIWIRELRRMVASLPAEPRPETKPCLVWHDDIEDAGTSHLPLVICRLCGTVAYGAVKRMNDKKVQRNVNAFYRAFFDHDPTLCLLFPDHSGEWDKSKPRKSFLCHSCLHLSVLGSEACSGCGGGHLTPVFVPDIVRTTNGRARANPKCPSCESGYGLSIVGSQAASLTSVLVAQLFGSRYNDDKKLLAFSDSVQDASHRAGFFQARTYQFTLRSALAQYVKESVDDTPLNVVADDFVTHMRQQRDDDDFTATFIAPDQTWRADYEHLCEHGQLPVKSNLPRLVQQRLHWDVISSFGFMARFGRTLENTLVCAATPAPARLKKATKDLLEPLRNEIGGLESVSLEKTGFFLSGLLYHLRISGAIHHAALKQYMADSGNYYKMSSRFVKYMPPVGRHSRTPAFLTNRRIERFIYLGPANRRSWIRVWARKCLFDDAVVSYERQAFYLAICSLDSNGLLQGHDTGPRTVWSIPQRALLISKDVQRFCCSVCSHTVTASAAAERYWRDAPCQRYQCRGRYREQETGQDYYRSLYQSSDFTRIVADEHTGLLSRMKREEVEGRFMKGARPWDSNLLSCTPTLELGVDIGDLSSLILCSVPPSQASYIQRVGRAGRRDGNALALTVAGAVPHDLYFFADPLKMIAESIKPPRLFLDAPAVLERQLAAYCMDCWVATGIEKTAIPPSLRHILATYANEDARKFPRNWLQFVETNTEHLLFGFFALFGSHISDRSKSHLRTFISGSETNGASPLPLWSKIFSGLDRKRKEQKELRGKLSRLKNKLQRLAKSPKDKNTVEKQNRLRQERKALRQILKEIGNTHVFRFLTDEGVLPNYAFPQAGATLRSVLYRKTADGAWKSWTDAYVRPSGAAIREFAPGSTFYAGGRKVQIDQIDVDISDVERWRFCKDCAHHQELDSEADGAACPRCRSASWRDLGRQRPMVKLQQVYATTRDKTSRSRDEVENRERTHFHVRMLILPNKVETSFVSENEEVPFGFDYLTAATFLEVNFGEQSADQAAVVIAGEEVRGRGFSCCTSCGKVKPRDSPLLHAQSCTARQDDSSQVETVYLYRKFYGEAIRVLLPFTTAGSSDKDIDSFAAGLLLGLERRHGGNLDHLQVTTQDNPIPDSPHRKRYLFLYDTVPGGTGYLKTLAAQPETMLDVLRRACEVLISCPCTREEDKDGCYHCLYKYRNRWKQDKISRTTALNSFRRILKYCGNLKHCESLDGIRLSRLLESEFERRFISVLSAHVQQASKGLLRNHVVRGKDGYWFSLGDQVYEIELQASVGKDEHIHIASRADFVIWPSDKRLKPVVVFADGYGYHKNRLGEDTAQRMALLRSGKFLVWSVVWEDLIKQDTTHSIDYIPLDNTRSQASQFENFVCSLESTPGLRRIAGISGKNSLAWLLDYLEKPEAPAWQALAYIHALFNDLTEPSPKWAHSLQAMAPDFIEEEFPNDPTDFCGMFRRKDSPTVTVLTRVSTDTVRNRDTSSVHLLAHIDDREDARTYVEFKREWAGFLRAMNLYQFLPHTFFSSQTGLDQNLYDPLDPGVKPDFAWQEAIELAPEHSSLLLELSRYVTKAPEVGFEMTGKNGIVLASAELAWPDQHVAVLTEYELENRSTFDESGWTVFRIEDTSPSDVVQALREARP